ncbi:MAG: ATP-binding protein, partial [Ilumatobacteraceae bacterium]
MLPLILAIGGLLAVTVRDGLAEIGDAELGAELGATWEPLVATMRAIETERAVSATGDVDAITEARRASNQMMVEMDSSLRRLGESQPLLVQLGQALSSLGLARGAVDDPAQGAARGLSADDSFNATKADLVAVGRLLPTEAGSEELARSLTAVAALAEIDQGSIVVLNTMEEALAGDATEATFDRMVVRIDRVDQSLDLFQATAAEKWTDDFRATGISRALGDTRRLVTGEAPVLEPSDVERLAGAVGNVADLRDELALDVVETLRSDARAIALRTWIQVAVTAAAILLALALAYLVSRSITRRVRAVSGAAQEVSNDRLPVLVDALRDPRGRTELPEVVEIDQRGSDELAELASSFNRLQTTLGDVASEQIDVLRRGVSDIFVTMARRNRSLVDRQLALLDELENSVEDPEVLADYYRLDHLATRMRRNSESLLVLANSETMRRRSRPAPIDDVVRAAISEVEDYRRVDIVSLEHLNVRGAVVADVAHLLAELLDNATAFSPPTSRVRLTGDLIDGEYRILIIDDGVGISNERLADLNDLLAHPPVLGLSVEPTLGMSVVSLLAAKHGVHVELAQGTPGTLAKVALPESTFERRLVHRGEPDDDVDDSVVPALRAPSLASSLSPVPDHHPEKADDPAPVPSRATDDEQSGDDEQPSDEPPREQGPTPSRRERRHRAKEAKRRAKQQAEQQAERRASGGRRRRRASDASRTDNGDDVEASPPGGVIGDPLSIRLSDVLVTTSDDGPSDELAALARHQDDEA